MAATDDPRPADFWRRYAAWSLDATPAMILACALTSGSLRTMTAAVASAGLALADALARLMVRMFERGNDAFIAGLVLHRDTELSGSIHALAAALTTGLWPTVIVFVLLLLSFHVAFEQSRWRATPGKRMLGMKVTDANGGAPTLSRSLLRNLAGALSWLSLNIGHALAALPPQHRALHDRIAGTRVLAMPSSSTSLPGWAKAWLVAQVALSVIVLACAATWLQRALDVAIVRALG